MIYLSKPITGLLTKTSQLFSGRVIILLASVGRAGRNNIAHLHKASNVRCYFMTDFSTVKKIGYRQAFKAVTVGLVIAYVIMALMAGPLWLFQFGFISGRRITI